MHLNLVGALDPGGRGGQHRGLDRRTDPSAPAEQKFYRARLLP
jgi:hypothetical protein